MSKKGMSRDMYDYIKHISKDVIYDLDRGIVITPRGTNGTVCSTTGYLRFRVNNRVLQVHQFLAVIYFGEKCVGLQVNHIDGNKMNNKKDNLEVISQRDNLRHQQETGLYSRGSSHINSKLTEEDVLNIRELNKNNTTMYRLSKIYNVSETTISNIVKRVTWKHI